MRTRLVRLLLVVLVGCGVARGDEPVAPNLAAYRGSIDGFAEEVAALEKLDQEQTDPEQAVLLVGSSSIRLWETADDDLAPWPVIRRGYGGATYGDLAHYIKRLATPHKYQAAVVFVANDITGGESDKSPEEVAKLFGYVADVLRWHQPEAHVLCMDIRPTPSRFAAWDQIQAANEALRKACERRERVHFVAATPAFLTADGKPRPELHVEDQLHLNRAGYDAWSVIIRQHLMEALRE